MRMFDGVWVLIGECFGTSTGQFESCPTRTQLGGKKVFEGHFGPNKRLKISLRKFDPMKVLFIFTDKIPNTVCGLLLTLASTFFLLD